MDIKTETNVAAWEEQKTLTGPDGKEIVRGLEVGQESKQTVRGVESPRLKKPNREQMVMTTVDVEELIPADHPARAIWELVGGLDLSGYAEQIKSVEGMAGRPRWDPQLLMSLWLYGYSDGVNSGREIERLCGHDPAYRWLAGMEKVNHHTLSDFRTGHKEELDGLFAQLLGLLRAEGMISLERVTQDGTKIKAYASSKSFKREDKIKESIRVAKEYIEEIDQIGEVEMNRRRMKARARAARERKENLDKALEELEKVRKSKKGQEREDARASVSDPEARKMRHGDGGFSPSYNVQLTTDVDNKIIVGVDVTQAANDYEGLQEGIDQVAENLGETPKQVLVDGGYVNANNIIEMDRRGIDLIAAFGNQHLGTTERRGIAKEFQPEKFTFDPENDIYLCPTGKSLVYIKDQIEGRNIAHLYQAAATDCLRCAYKEQCCPKAIKKGRTITRSEARPEVAALAAKMETEQAKAIYKQRAPVAEFPHLWIKEKLGLRQFRLRGLEKVRTETLWACFTYNVQQWIRLRWRPQSAP
jgi:transposase